MRLFLLFLLATTWVTGGVSADLTSREKRMVETVNVTVRKAGASFQGGKYDEAAGSILRAIKQLEIATSTGSVELYDAMQPAMKRIATAHAMLELEGVSLPPFRKPPRPEPTAESARAPAMSGKNAATTAEFTEPSEGLPADGISFTKQVAPVLVSRCGRCHVSSDRGDFSMATFAALMKGPPEGVVIFAGDTIGSRLIETIKTGAMPKGGGKVTPDELKLLETWIEQGAKFDGDDPGAPLGGGSPAATPQRNQPTVVMATGRETVSFAADIAPILVENCKGCHIDAMQVRGGLRMDTFALLLRGGDSGAVVTPGKSADSLLVQKLRGMGDGERMPAGGRPALSEDAIKLVTTWIDEGATLDGASATQPIAVMAQLAWASNATAQQISEKRTELAGKNLSLVVTSKQPAIITTDHFTVVGPVDETTLRLVADAAEEQMETVRTLIDASSGESFFRGRATIFVMPRRYDYSEFAKMVEGRDVPSDWTSHWKFDGIDAYISMVATDRDEQETILNRLISPLVSLAVATRGGDVPRWFAQGAGTTIAARSIRSEDSFDRDRQRAQIRAAVAATDNAKRFLDGKLTPEQSDHVGAAVMASMLDAKQRKYFDQVIRQMAGGSGFDAAFTKSFGLSLPAYIDRWLQYARR
tara:strand:- start:46574 stop:48505 length:1932 start_codon:yes stop_codon:yes gene_type:complete